MLVLIIHERTKNSKKVPVSMSVPVSSNGGFEMQAREQTR